MSRYILEGRMNDQEYIEYLECEIKHLETKVKAAEDKFNEYINRQHKDSMNQMGMLLKIGLDATKPENKNQS